MPTLLRVAPELPVADITASIEYYRSKLGFRETMMMPDGDYAIVERGEVAIHLFQADSSCRVSIHIFASNIDLLHDELRSRGAQITQPVVPKPWGARDFRVRDDAGNEIKFTEDC